MFAFGRPQNIEYGSHTCEPEESKVRTINPIVIIEYRPEWAEEFTAIARPLREALGELALRCAPKCTRQYLPGGLLINAMEILPLCGAASGKRTAQGLEAAQRQESREKHRDLWYTSE